MEAVVTHPRLQRIEYIDLNCRPDMMPFYGKFNFQPITQVQFMRWQPGATPDRALDSRSDNRSREINPRKR